MPAQNVRFGRFQLDLKTGELFQNGSSVPLQEQPFQILKMLLERPGEVIRKEEIRETLWSDDTIVEFENSVHPAIKKLRVALADSAENPTYIETLPRKGYRFIGPLEVSEPEQAAVVPLALPEGVANWPHLEQDETDGVETKALDKATKKDPSAWLVASVLALLIGAGVIYWISRRARDEASDGPMVASLTTSGWGWQPSFSP